MRADSPRQEDFAETLRRKLCLDIQAAINAVPDFDPSWYGVTAQNFRERFGIDVNGINALPNISIPRAL